MIEKVKDMKLEKFTKVYIVTSSIIIVIAVVGIIFGFGYKAVNRKNNGSTEVKAASHSSGNTEAQTKNYSRGNKECSKEYVVELTKTDAVITFSTTLPNPFTGSEGGDVWSYYLYYDSNFNVYYRCYNSTYIPYTKDDGSWYKWNVEKGEIE